MCNQCGSKSNTFHAIGCPSSTPETFKRTGNALDKMSRKDRPLLFNPAASYDFGFDSAQQWHEHGCVEGDNAYQFTLDEATANRGESDFLETCQ